MRCLKFGDIFIKNYYTKKLGGRNLRPPINSQKLRMAKNKNIGKISDEIILNKIFVLRQKKVMIEPSMEIFRLFECLLK